jgi:hypothetical protein
VFFSSAKTEAQAFTGCVGKVSKDGTEKKDYLRDVDGKKGRKADCWKIVVN